MSGKNWDKLNRAMIEYRVQHEEVVAGGAIMVRIHGGSWAAEDDHYRERAASLAVLMERQRIMERRAGVEW